MGIESLAAALEAVVPLYIWSMQERGGPTDADWQKAIAFGPVLAEKGDNILYRSTRPGETADLFNRLVHAISVMSFAPGGVTAFGIHWGGYD